MRTLALLVLIALAGCNREKSVYSSRDGSVTLEKKHGDVSTMKITGSDGKQVSVDFNAGSVPADYPKDIPVYGGAKTVMAQSTNEKNAHTLMLETADPVNKIADFYKSELEKNGWKTENTVATGEMHMMNATKDKRDLLVQIMNSNDKRTISQIVTEK